MSEVKKIVLRHDENDSDDDLSGLDDMSSHRELDEKYVDSVVQNRKFMARRCLRRGKDPRYAFKTMQEEHRRNPGVFLNACVDLVMEFKFLSTVRHPNIIKMRAVSAGDLFQSHAFIVLDKIYDTLKVRIDKWKKQDANAFKLFDFQKKKEKNFLAKRLLVAFDVASALAYLHDMNIMYRDLKENNVGFDVRDDPKIFDL